MFNLSIMSSSAIKIPAVTHGHSQFCSINGSKKSCSLYFAEYISVLMSTEAVDSITVSAHLIHEQLPRSWKRIVELRLFFVLGFLLMGRLAPEIQGPILQCDEYSQLRVLCAAQETLNILQNAIFGKTWVCFCEHLPFLYRALKSNTKDR